MVQHTQPQNKSSIDSLANKSPRNDAKAVVNIAQFKATEEVDATTSAFVKVMAQMNIDTRSAFDEAYEQRWVEASNENSLLSVLLCDIDYFKAYKDNCGEQSTSFMLIVVALKLKNICDEYGCFLAYYQNDGFAILHKGGDEKQALEIAEALRQAVEESKTEHKFSEISDVVTLSIGVSSIYPTSMKQLIDRADQSLQKFKKTTLDKVAKQKKAQPSIEVTTKNAEVKPVPKSKVEHKIDLDIKPSTNKAETKTAPVVRPIENNLNKEKTATLSLAEENKAETKTDSVAKPITNQPGKEKPLTLSLAEENKAEMKTDSVTKPITNQLGKEKPLTLSLAEENKAETKTDSVTKPITNQSGKEKPLTLSLTEDSQQETKISSAARPIENKAENKIDSIIKANEEKTDALNNTETNNTENEKKPIVNELNEENIYQTTNELDASSTPVKKKAVKRHINALKALVTKTSKQAKPEPSTSEKAESINTTTLQSESLQQSLKETESLTLETENNVRNNVPDLTKPVAPKSAIERHIEALKATKVQKPTNTVKATDDELSNKTTSNSSLNNQLTTNNETQKATPKSTMELHIEALKASKKAQQQTTQSVVPVKDESTAGSASENKVDKNLSMKIESEKSTSKAPKSAIERHIEALKATKKTNNQTSISSSKIEKPEQALTENKITNTAATAKTNIKTENKPGLTLAENEVTSKAPLAKPEVKKEDKPELSLTENEVSSKAPAKPEVKKEEKPELTLTENEITTKAPPVKPEVKKEDKPELSLTENEVSSKAPAKPEVKKEEKPALSQAENKVTSAAASAKVENKPKVENETVIEKTPELSKEKSEAAPAKSAIQRHIEALKAAKSLSSTKSTPVKPAFSSKGRIEQTEEIAQAGDDQQQENTELQKRLLAEMVEGKFALDKKLKAIWQECLNEDELLSMIFVGVDFFKPYQENNGEQASENLLVNIASALRKRSDQADTHIYHTGKQYFVILHKGGNATKALRLAEKLRKGVEGQGIANKDSSVSKVVTLSLGLFSIFPDNTNSIGMLTSESEEAYDMAIRSGRNNTYFGWR